MLANLNGWHLLILVAVILLLFGAAKLPVLAKSMGQSARLFKGEMRAMKDENDTPAAIPTVGSTVDATPVPTPVASHSAPDPRL